jgi:Flp pilus assembly protein TadB
VVTTDEILKKYQQKIQSQIETDQTSSPVYSRDYEQFKQDMLPDLSKYKRWADSLGRIIKIKVSDKESSKIQRYLDIAHLDVTPSQSAGLALVAMLLTLFLTFTIVTSAIILGKPFPIMLTFLGFILSAFVYFYVYSMPKRLSNIWRLKASSQMIPAILYIVIYMKHTSNLERAVQFTSEHLDTPLALDFKKVLYDVETGRFQTVKQSLDAYLETWRDYSPEFIESFHLIESSLYEPSDAQRVNTLERALQVMLDGVYDKMLSYSRDIRAPLTNVYMLGIILPTLALALLPLASVVIAGGLKWYHLFVIFNLIIPLGVYFMTSEILLKRPGGYGENSNIEKNPEYYKFVSSRPWLIAGIICIPLFIIGLLPFIMQSDFITSILGIKSDYTFGELGFPFFQNEFLFDFKTLGSSTVGPFGILGVILSLFIPLSIASFFSISYKLKTKEIIKARKETKELEKEFTSTLFQLGNRLGDGVPAERVFSRVAESSQGQKTQSFFYLVNQNIQQMGMPIDQAVFNPQRGAIIYYPSAIISTSMKILIESVKKGLKIAARAMMSISDYVKNIQKINDRLRDLLAEVVSDMRSNMVFLAPLLSGIIVGLTSMIAVILNKLKSLSDLTSGGAEIAGIGSIGNIVNLFDITSVVPPYFVQVSIGIYLVEIIFILTGTLVTVDSGKDELQEKNELSRNLKKGITLYLITTLIGTLALTGLAAVALAGLG